MTKNTIPSPVLGTQEPSNAFCKMKRVVFSPSLASNSQSTNLIKSLEGSRTSYSSIPFHLSQKRFPAQVQSTKCFPHSLTLPLWHSFLAPYLYTLNLLSVVWSHTSRKPNLSRSFITWSSGCNFSVERPVSQCWCSISFSVACQGCILLLSASS